MARLGDSEKLRKKEKFKRNHFKPPQAEENLKITQNLTNEATYLGMF